MNKKIILIVVALFLVLGITLLYGIAVYQDRAHQEKYIEREYELQRKAEYATAMHLIVYDCSAGTKWPVQAELALNRRNLEEVQFTEIIFVHTPEEAAQFGEHVLVAWPQENRYTEGRERPYRGTQMMIDALNEGIHRVFPHIDFRDYGLPENEITMSDVIDNWEVVNELLLQYGAPAAPRDP